MSVAQLEEHVVPMVQRLAVDVGWAARVSACGLFGLVIHKKGISPGSASSMKELCVTFTHALRHPCSSSVCSSVKFLFNL